MMNVMQNEMKKPFLEDYQEVERLYQKDRSELLLVLHQASGKLFIKRIMPFSESSYGVFQRLKTVKCDNLLQIEDVFCVDDKLIVIEEYVRGKTLQNYLDIQGVFCEEEVIHITEQLCKALTGLHENNIVHRDIKPSNIMLDETGIIKLIDFDAARISGGSSNQDTKLLGTEGYAPPEQYGFAETDNRADLYALGITIKELLGAKYAGRLSPIITTCTKVDPDKRFQSISAISKKLEDIKHPMRRIVRRGAIVVLIAAALLYTGNYIYEMWKTDYADIIPIEENLVELQYAVNQSEEDSPGKYFKDDSGSLLFSEDGPSPGGWNDVSGAGWSNPRYITYTRPRSYVNFSLNNNSEFTLINPIIRFQLNDVIIWDKYDDGWYDMKGIRYDNHIYGVGAYGEVVWETDENVRPKTNKKFVVPFSEAVIVGENPYVTVTIAADNYPAKSFQIPIGFYVYNGEDQGLKSESILDKNTAVGINLYGLNFAEIKEIYGDGYAITEHEFFGGGHFVSYEEEPFLFLFDSSIGDQIGDLDSPVIIWVLEGGMVAEGISVGMTFDEIVKAGGRFTEVGESGESEGIYGVLETNTSGVVVLLEADTLGGRTSSALIQYE